MKEDVMINISIMDPSTDVQPRTIVLPTAETFFYRGNVLDFYRNGPSGPELLGQVELNPQWSRISINVVSSSHMFEETMDHELMPKSDNIFQEVSEEMRVSK